MSERVVSRGLERIWLESGDQLGRKRENLPDLPRTYDAAVLTLLTDDRVIRKWFKGNVPLNKTYVLY